MQYDHNQFLRELGARVKQLRGKHSLSRRQMIAKNGFHLNQLSQIELGKPVSLQTLLKLCAAFDLKLEELVEGLGTGGPDKPAD